MNKTMQLNNRLIPYPLRALVMCLLFILCSAKAQEFDTANLNTYIESKVEKNQFMGVVLVAKGDDPLFFKAFGLQAIVGEPTNPELRKEKRIKNDTVFPIASLTKQFIAVSLLRLSETNKLSLSDSICKYLTSCPKLWKSISIEHLLTHTSGIPDYTQTAEFKKAKHLKRTRDEVLQQVQSKPLMFTPGSTNQYSNTGYFLLGEIIERVTNQSVAEFLNETLFVPLQMTATSFSRDFKVAGHRSTNSKIEATPLVDWSNVYSAGAITSSASDLVRWNQALYSHKVISTVSLAKLVGNNGTGMGVNISQRGVQEDNQVDVYQFSGKIDGFTSVLSFLPQFNMSVVVLSNVESEASLQINSFILDHLTKLSINQAVSSNPVAPSNNTLSSFVGTYQMERKGVNTKITSLEDKLIAQLPGMPPMVLIAKSNNQFQSEDFDVSISFKQDNNNNVVGLIVKMRGMMIPGRKISNDVATKQAIHLSEAELIEFVGSYRIPSQFDIEVELRNGTLFAQATGQQGFNIYPEGEQAFFAKVIELQIIFHKNDSGRVTALTIKQGPVKTKANKI